jgi:glycosyltransferase involved in cell wall biosynthesis
VADGNRVIIIVPAYNEEQVIAKVLGSIRQVVGDKADIVVINDGSCDDTAGAAQRAGVTVLSHPFNMGYGVTIQTGYKYAWSQGYSYLVQIDGDGQHDPAFIVPLLKLVQSGVTDMALGSRFLDADSYRPPLARRIGMVFFGSLLSLLIGKRITDPTSGYQACNRRIVEFFTSDTFPCDYPDADVLLMLGLAGFHICEVPVRMYANSTGKSMHSGLKPVYYVFKMLLSMLVTLMRSRTRRLVDRKEHEHAD